MEETTLLIEAPREIRFPTKRLVLVTFRRKFGEIDQMIAVSRTALLSMKLLTV